MSTESTAAREPAAIPILDQGEGWLAVNKPSGLSIHESSYTGPCQQTLIGRLREQLGVRRLHAVHRLDHATSGVMLLAFDPSTTAALAAQFESRQVAKSYLAVVRGHPPEQCAIDLPLSAGNGRGDPKPACTLLRALARLSLPIALNRYPQARYGLVLVWPQTGRHHQIRRHLKHLAHPIVGDVNYGKGEHNRLFRQHFGIHRLLLHALTLEFTDPCSSTPRRIRAPLDDAFSRAVGLFDVDLESLCRGAQPPDPLSFAAIPMPLELP